jgi:hypothetical protein
VFAPRTSRTRCLSDLERQHLRNAGDGIVARLTTQALCLDALTDIVEFSVACDLKGKLCATGLRTGFKSDNKITMLGREIGAAVVPLGYVKAVDLGEVGDLALDVRRLQSNVAESSGSDHGILQMLILSVVRSRTVCCFCAMAITR